jgi:hypothetical protein
VAVISFLVGKQECTEFDSIDGKGQGQSRQRERQRDRQTEREARTREGGEGDLMALILMKWSQPRWHIRLGNRVEFR